MIINDETFPPATFEEFCDSNGLVVTVRERGGEGAVLSYKRRLAGRKIVVDNMTPQRRALQCPNEWRESR